MVLNHIVVCMQVKTLFPSVRCGLEMAVLEALAASAKCTLLELLLGCKLNDQQSNFTNGSIEHKNTAAMPQVCGLLDSMDSPGKVADAAATLVGEGFSTLKLKVGRSCLHESFDIDTRHK